MTCAFTYTKSDALYVIISREPCRSPFTRYAPGLGWKVCPTHNNLDDALHIWEPSTVLYSSSVSDGAGATTMVVSLIVDSVRRYASLYRLSIMRERRVTERLHVLLVKVSSVLSESL